MEKLKMTNIFASLLVAQWLGRWCTSPVAQTRFLACPVQRQLLKGGKSKWCCCHLPHFRVLHAYVLTCLQDLGQGLSLRDSNLQPLGQCFNPKLQKGNSWRYPRISGPTYCLTSWSPVVRALVYQPSGPGSFPGMSRSETAITRGKT